MMIRDCKISTELQHISNKSIQSMWKQNKTQHNSKWPYIPGHSYRILILGGSGSGKTHALLNLINNQLDIDKIYLYPKDPDEGKYQYQNVKY